MYHFRIIGVKGTLHLLMAIALFMTTNTAFAANFAWRAGELSGMDNRSRISLRSDWCFHLGDSEDATTNVTWYPEVSDLAKPPGYLTGTFIHAKSTSSSIAHFKSSLSERILITQGWHFTKNK